MHTLISLLIPGLSRDSRSLSQSCLVGVMLPLWLLIASHRDGCRLMRFLQSGVSLGRCYSLRSTCCCHASTTTSAGLHSPGPSRSCTASLTWEVVSRPSHGRVAVAVIQLPWSCSTRCTCASSCCFLLMSLFMLVHTRLIFDGHLVLCVVLLSVLHCWAHYFVLVWSYVMTGSSVWFQRRYTLDISQIYSYF